MEEVSADVCIFHRGPQKVSKFHGCSFQSPWACFILYTKVSGRFVSSNGGVLDAVVSGT